ncbi:hypothetical protein GIB67_040183 [Kingdonia uniflora]|uniref:Glycosyltransferase n=1 Tax=Kingdonia uniflora TaxID=39325 RepID=A0A7J7MUR7_9MAGN|nr:hypothetical protein GIB67_040183 [Kingdonia uniflora]
MVLFPFMAQGHIIPCLALALQLEQKTNCRIIIVNTPLNIRNIRSSLPPNTSIRLKELPFTSTDHGLPPDSENTDVLPYPLIMRLLDASKTLKQSFNKFVVDLTKQQDGNPPVCIIADMFLGWTVEIAKELGIFHSIFNTGGAYGTAIYYSLWIHLPHCKTTSDEFLLPDFPEASVIHRTQLANHLSNADGSDSWSIFNQSVLPLWFKSDGIIFNTIEGLEKTGLEYFRRNMTGRPVWCIGPVRCSSIRPQKKSGIGSDQCINWLDTHPPASVLFVSFGSQNSISCQQMMELAIGLEKSKKSFIWVIRPPLEFYLSEEFQSKWLPKGFEDRIKEGNRGLLVHKWAPQLEILSHRSTAAFLSHCGWNSTLESLIHGVPIIAWPLAGEQHYNSKFLVEVAGVCVEVARGNVSDIKHEDVVRVIELVMGGTEKGEDMRKKVTKVAEMIEDAIRDTDEGLKGSSVKALDKFIDAVLTKRCNSDYS